MEKKVPIIIVCRPRGGEKIITQANDAASSIAGSIRQLLVLNQNIFPEEISCRIKHASNEKEFCYRYEITISTDEVDFTKHALILTSLLSTLSGIIKDTIRKLDDSENVVLIDKHIEDFVEKLESQAEIEDNILKYKKIMKKMGNALKKAAIHVEVQFLKDLNEINVDLVDFSKKIDHSYGNPSRKNQIPLWGTEKPSEVEGEEIIDKQEEEEKYIENFDIMFKAEQYKPGMITVNPYLRGKRIIIETDPRINNRIVDNLNEFLSRNPLRISMDIEKSPTNTYKAYDIIDSEDEIR
jgi:hypothetical protein